MGLPPNANALAAAIPGKWSQSIEGSAHLHALPAVIGPIDQDLVSSHVNRLFTTSISPTACHSNPANYPVPVPGALHCHLAYELFGSSLGSANAMAYTKMKSGLQCHAYRMKDCGDWPESDCHLPQVMGLGKDFLFKRFDNARKIQELQWAYKVLWFVNASVQPETYEIAEKVNPNVIDSVFPYGQNYSGGQWNFGPLGVSFCANLGYSLHAWFKYLDHSVGPIILIPQSESPPLQVLLALYSHADVYSSTARVAGYSDTSMWLPFPLARLSVLICRKVSRKRENQWRNVNPLKVRYFESKSSGLNVDILKL
ncbi:hypothetical protein DFH28DRAFT_1083884 [Melampsora americana]|nr:hypothetical protein DFH28DRAFT_1083884 [Melampsora americana]